MAGTMKAPASGVKIRMYRHGHGDCYLLAFAGRKGRSKETVYVLIDCGLKPGSEVDGQKIDEIVDDIVDATDGHIHVVAITHEHQDHVSGFAKKVNGKHVFDKLSVDQCWLPWTEDGSDELANALRERFRDTLVALAFAQEKVSKLQGAYAAGLKERVADLLGTEIGDDGKAPDFGKEGRKIVSNYRKKKETNSLLGASTLAEFAIKGISNKKAIKYVRNRANDEVKFLSPEDDPVFLPHAEKINAYVLGPPRNEALLLDLNPKGNEKFHLAPSGGSLAVGQNDHAFAMAVAPEMVENGAGTVFESRYCFNAEVVFDHDPSTTNDVPRKEALDYLRTTYGGQSTSTEDEDEWRRIDEEWLGMSEMLALRLNNEVNNTSLVLAFELPKTGKVLLFTGDAQRGSWLGWADLKWKKDGQKEISAKELLGRCVLYKVGHHGSHNATLNGTDRDTYANIGWMARGRYADDFVAMIPANTTWAMAKTKPWRHPLPEIESALLDKARGRVFRTDRKKMAQPDASTISQDEWDAFTRNVKETDLYFDYVILDR